MGISREQNARQGMATWNSLLITICCIIITLLSGGPWSRLYIIAINYQQFTGLEVSSASGGGDINQSEASIQVT